MDVWEKVMAKWVDLKTILYFDCAEEELVKRLLFRGQTSGRSDDNEETIRKRLHVFNEHSKPVIDHYSKLGKVCRIDANKPVDKITHEVE
jgi:adenylate kinase family enzyme